MDPNSSPLSDNITTIIQGIRQLRCTLEHPPDYVAIKAGILDIQDGTAYPNPLRGRLQIERQGKQIIVQYVLRPTNEVVWTMVTKPDDYYAHYLPPPQYPRVLSLRLFPQLTPITDAAFQERQSLSNHNIDENDPGHDDEQKSAHHVANIFNHIATKVRLDPNSAQQHKRLAAFAATQHAMIHQLFVDPISTIPSQTKHFWLQEEDQTKDVELINTLNSLLRPNTTPETVHINPHIPPIFTSVEESNTPIIDHVTPPEDQPSANQAFKRAKHSKVSLWNLENGTDGQIAEPSIIPLLHQSHIHHDLSVNPLAKKRNLDSTVATSTTTSTLIENSFSQDSPTKLAKKTKCNTAAASNSHFPNTDPNDNCLPKIDADESHESTQDLSDPNQLVSLCKHTLSTEPLNNVDGGNIGGNNGSDKPKKRKFVPGSCSEEQEP